MVIFERMRRERGEAAAGRLRSLVVVNKNGSTVASLARTAHRWRAYGVWKQANAIEYNNVA
jgi:hypothetical protein